MPRSDRSPGTRASGRSPASRHRHCSQASPPAPQGPLGTARPSPLVHPVVFRHIERHATARPPQPPGSVASTPLVRGFRVCDEGEGSMGQQAWRAYAEMALGMTDASRKKATKAVKRLLGRGGATAEQLQGLAEDLRQTSAANREALTKLIRVELDRALGRVGLATADEVADLTARVRELENQLSQARTAAPAVVEAAGNGAPAGVTATGRAQPAAELGDAVAAAVPSRPPRKVAKKTVPGRAEPAAPPAATAGGTAKGGTAARGTAARGTTAGGTALASLAAAGELPPEGQIEAFESTHQTLRETLSTIEES